MQIEINIKPKATELLVLFSQTEWAKNRDHNKILGMLKSNDLCVCLREFDKLIGYGRIISDGCFRGLLDDVIIDSSFRSKGYGAIVINELLKLSEDIDEIFLNADHNLFDYYSKFGFERFSGLTMIRKSF